MNKTKIEWTDYSWNPITGCLHNCWYCYAKRMFHRFGRSFEPTFYPERLKELKKQKKPAKIFVCSVADLFAPWTKPKWTQKVLDEIQKPEYNHLTFQLLTKQPVHIAKFNLKPKKNIWVGVTITNQAEMTQYLNLIETYMGLKFISFEPLLGVVDIPCQWLAQLHWIIVGKLTGSKKIPLKKEWVESLIKQAREFKIPIFIKDNVKWSEKIQEYPKQYEKQM